MQRYHAAAGLNTGYFSSMRCVNLRTTVFILNIGILLTTMTTSSFGESDSALPPFLNYYEPVHSFVVVTSPLVISRTVRYQKMSFYAYQRNFKLHLEYKPDVFVPDAEVTIRWGGDKVTRQSIKKYNEHFVNGRLETDNTSSIIGSFFNGNFEGIIYASSETYYVEPTSRHFGINTNFKFKSIIFRKSDINTSELTCGQDNGLSTSACLRSKSVSLRKPNKRWTDRLYVRALRQAVPSIGEFDAVQGNNICMLKLFADHTFFQFATDHTTERTIQEMRLIVAEAGTIFRNIDFNTNGRADAFDFQVTAVEIIYDNNTANYYMHRPDLTVDDFLSLFATYNLDAFCLGIAFTHRIFPSGILGYAYSGSSDPRRPGGLCQKRRRAQRTSYTKSYNCLVITIIDTSGKIMTRHTNGMHLAHEIGHAFGAPHDDLDNEECSPSSSKGGKFIMSPISLTWKEKNNDKFSHCSLTEMKKVLVLKGTCLTYRKPTCGNTMVEDGEECDCGDKRQCDSVDHCCTPSDGGIAGDIACNLRMSEGRLCSPRSFPCCTRDCQVTPSNQEKDCSFGNDCVYPTKCSGTSTQCPEAVQRATGTECRNRLGRCVDGQCKEYLCSIKKMYECNCTELRYMCQLCCKTNDSEECMPAVRFGLKTLSNTPFYKPVGERCIEGRGFCTHGGTCIAEFGYLVDEDYDHITTEGYNITNDSPEEETKVLIISLVTTTVGLVVVVIVCFLVYYFTPIGKKIKNWRQARINK